MHQAAQFLPLVFLLLISKKIITSFAFGYGFSSQWKIEFHAKPTVQHIDQ